MNPKNLNEPATKAGFVAVVGLPNAGKSTLINSALKTKLSIVTPKPQTTRKNVFGIYTDDDAQIVFVDTPGIVDPKYELHNRMLAYVETSFKDSDLILTLIDFRDLFGEEFPIREEFVEKMRDSKNKNVCAITKVDLLEDKKQLLPMIDKLLKTKLFEEVVPISALLGENVSELIETCKKYIEESEFFYDPELIGTQSERFFASELIREKIFELYTHELPYSAEVQILQFKRRENRKTYVGAEIIVERNSQKKIIVGAKGAMIRELGERSRKEIEEMFGEPIFLEIFVKTRPQWRRNKTFLKSYGYE